MAAEFVSKYSLISLPGGGLRQFINGRLCPSTLNLMHPGTRDVQNDVLTPPTTTPTQSICEEQPPTPTTTPIWPQFYHNLGVKLGVNWGYLTPIFINWHPQPNTNPIFGQKWPEIGDIHNWGPIFCTSLETTTGFTKGPIGDPILDFS